MTDSNEKSNACANREQCGSCNRCRKMNILVIDDDEHDQRQYRRWLKAHHVDIASSIADAVARTKEKRYDIVFCDVTMPEIHDLRPVDIIQFCKRIQGARLVVVSSTVDRGDTTKSLHALQQVVTDHQSGEAESICIDLMNDLQAMQRKIRGN